MASSPCKEGEHARKDKCEDEEDTYGRGSIRTRRIQDTEMPQSVNWHHHEDEDDAGNDERDKGVDAGFGVVYCVSRGLAACFLSFWVKKS